MVIAFPCKEMVLEMNNDELSKVFRKSTSKRISEKRVAQLVDKLTEIAKQSYCAVKKTSPILEEVRYFAQELLRLPERRQAVLDEMVILAQPLPEYDILLSIPDIAETTATSIIGELMTVIGFNLPIKSMLLLKLISDIKNQGTISLKNTLPNVGTLMLERFCSSVSITLLQLVTPILVISQISMRNEKGNRLIRTMYYLITHNKLYDYDSTQNQ